MGPSMRKTDFAINTDHTETAGNNGNPERDVEKSQSIYPSVVSPFTINGRVGLEATVTAVFWFSNHPADLEKEGEKEVNKTTFIQPHVVCNSI